MTITLLLLFHWPIIHHHLCNLANPFLLLMNIYLTYLVSLIHKLFYPSNFFLLSFYRFLISFVFLFMLFSSLLRLFFFSRIFSPFLFPSTASLFSLSFLKFHVPERCRSDSSYQGKWKTSRQTQPIQECIKHL